MREMPEPKPPLDERFVYGFIGFRKWMFSLPFPFVIVSFLTYYALLMCMWPFICFLSIFSGRIACLVNALVDHG
jgi:hypothetical protein